MEEQPSPLRSLLFTQRELPFFEGIGDYIRTRRPSDQLIFAILGLLVIASCALAFFALERAILVVEPVDGGSLTEGDVGAPRFINPLLAISDTDQDLTALTYAGLMGIGPNGTVVPALAQSYIISPDGKTYQFTIRSNAKFSDGTPVTADDVVFTVQKAQDPLLKSPQAANWSDVTVKAIDEHTVQFTLQTAYAPFLYDTTLGILPEHLWQNVTDDEFPFSSLELKPVGAGPFVPSGYTQDSNGDVTDYTLVANPAYVLGRPYLDSFHFLFYTDQSSLQTAITNGQVESGYGVIGAHNLTAPYARVFAVFFNSGENDLLANQAVRQALSLAIDRGNIVSQVLGGYATALGGPVPPGSGVSNVPAPSADDRLNLASNLLTQAGLTYASSTGEWQKSSGEALSITLKTSNAPELKVLAEAVQTDWKEIGVPVALQYYEPGDLTQNVIRPRAFQALLFGMVVGKGDDLYDFWDSQESSDPGLNITSYSNPAVDKLLGKLRTETDPIAHAQDLAQINTLIAADYPAAFIEAPDFVYAVPNDLKGVILPQITAPSDRFANVANWYRRTESVWPFLVNSGR
jgi:peptide/nickel transport system substrate-binding protein